MKNNQEVVIYTIELEFNKMLVFVEREKEDNLEINPPVKNKNKRKTLLDVRR